MTGAVPGLMLVTAAAVANATFTLPMKFARHWAWENIWLVWSFLALLVLPVCAAMLSIPSLELVYREAGFGAVAIVAVCGAGWGLAQVLFGLSVDAIGIGLAFSIVLGISAAVGSLIPFLRMGRSALTSPAAGGVLLGVALVLAGVVACAVAGHWREKAQGTGLQRNRSFGAGLAMAICSGLCAASMNFGVAFGEPILKIAAAHGASAQQVVYAVWLPLLMAGALPNLLYCAYLLGKQRTWGNFRSAHTPAYGLLALLMAVLWFFSTALYGIATRWLGDLGVVVGWPVFMSLIVITASLLGILTGEWKRSGRAPVLLQLAGMLLLVLAVVAFSRAQRSSTPASHAVIQHNSTVLCSAGSATMDRINVR
jgi:L-rhamnose-H+ transport protein